MTPFDPAALLTMLLAFYPIVSAAAFAQARRERPEYFAGGQIFGSKGDKLRLPDGREFDCIIAAGGPASGRRWSCSEIVDDPNAVPDPFELEPGPLDPVDEDMAIFAESRDTFAALVAGELDALTGADGVLQNAGDAVGAADLAGGLEDSYRRLVEPAAVAHAGTVTALDADDFGDVIAATESHGAAIEAGEAAYADELPPALAEPDPGNPPPPEPDEPKPEPPAF